MIGYSDFYNELDGILIAMTRNELVERGQDISFLEATIRAGWIRTEFRNYLDRELLPMFYAHHENVQMLTDPVHGNAAIARLAEIANWADCQKAVVNLMLDR